MAEETPWRPISEAPLDGHTVILFSGWKDGIWPIITLGANWYGYPGAPNWKPHNATSDMQTVTPEPTHYLPMLPLPKPDAAS